MSSAVREAVAATGYGDGMSRPSLVAAVGLALLVAGSIVGCSSARPGRVPTTIGVVTSVVQVTGRTYAYHLDTGQVVNVDLSIARVLLPDGGPGVGYLFLSGTEPSGQTWVAGLYPYAAADVPPGCFQLVATGIGHDGSIDLSIGIRLLKASNFDPGPISDDRYVMDRASFCIGADGAVLSYG